MPLFSIKDTLLKLPLGLKDEFQSTYNAVVPGCWTENKHYLTIDKQRHMSACAQLTVFERLLIW